MIVGAHVSISGGIANAIQNALELNCETFQVFTKNQNQWREKIFSGEEIATFKKNLAGSAFRNKPLAAHDSYLINLCANETAKLEQSQKAFFAEIERCALLGIDYLIFHPGAHTGKGETWGVQQIAESLNRVMENLNGSPVTLLIETTAGQGSNLGYTFEQVKAIIDAVIERRRIGVCVDTCHIFAAGYDLRSAVEYERTIQKFDEIIGLTNIKAFHLNDSKKDLGSRVDRHERIGRGFLGESVFERLMNDARFEYVPGYLEIPGDEQAFQEDIALLKGLRSN